MSIGSAPDGIPDLGIGGIGVSCLCLEELSRSLVGVSYQKKGMASSRFWIGAIGQPSCTANARRTGKLDSG